MLPRVGSSKPVRHAMVVLFPEPFGPRNPKKLPAGTVSVKFSTAVAWPYVFVRPDTSIDIQRQLRPLDDSEHPFPSLR